LTAGTGYIGRFAPSPTGALHAGSLVAALASWLDARAHGGQWLVRIEDLDTPRCVKGADQTILRQLADCGLQSDGPVIWQSQRTSIYQTALDTLVHASLAYPCACSRKDIEQALQQHGAQRPRHAELIYPGTCRAGLNGRPARAWRLKTSHDLVHWTDRWLGEQTQDVAAEVGDFVLDRADGLVAYQLGVVVDDATQGITHVVRGQDLADNTARQITLQRALGLPPPNYLHTPLVLATDGQKLSKQNGAQPITTETPAQALSSLRAAAGVLGLDIAESAGRDNTASALSYWAQQWAAQWLQPGARNRHIPTSKP
jgi:glutamyl-Q tRNA(Asp) synthetase